jgi:alpha-tubulin suppressor-like RCC1 family protein
MSDLYTWGQGWANGHGVLLDTATPLSVFEGVKFKDISAGHDHGLVVLENGELWAWGGNYAGQLGIEEEIYNATPPVRSGNDSDWKYVYAGGYHSLAIKEDGTLWATGDAGNGALGTGHYYGQDRYEWTQVGTDTWLKANASFYASCGIKSDGTLWSWGYNTRGVLGLGQSYNQQDVLTPHQVGSSTWKDCSLGEETGLGIRSDGSLWGWGDNYDGNAGQGGGVDIQWDPALIYSRATPMPLTNDLVEDAIELTSPSTWAQTTEGATKSSGEPGSSQMQATVWFSLALTSAREVEIDTQGSDFDTMLAVYDTSFNPIADNDDYYGLQSRVTFMGQANTTYLIQAGGYGGDTGVLIINVDGGAREFGTDWVQVSCGEKGASAIKSDKTLWGWGRFTAGLYNAGGDDGSTYFLPKKVNNKKWLTVEQSDYLEFAMAIRSDHTLWVWGTGSGGYRFGMGPSMPNTLIGSSLQWPHQVGEFTDWVMCSAGDYVEMALRGEIGPSLLSANPLRLKQRSSQQEPEGPRFGPNAYW